jgi:polysaccharide deacetylase 2 family uncharacterized protein YibQ
MTPKRPGTTPRRRKKTSKRGRPDRLAVLFFFLGLVVAAGILYFGQELFSGAKGRQLAKAPAQPAREQTLPAKDSSQPAKQEPMLALVLDPSGADQDQLRDLQALKLPVTLQAPHGLPRSKEAQDLLSKAVRLDAEPGVQAAMWQLKQAERQAVAQGRAVAVARANPETTAALASWSVRRDGRIKLVPLARLLQSGTAQSP